MDIDLYAGSWGKLGSMENEGGSSEQPVVAAQNAPPIDERFCAGWTPTSDDVRAELVAVLDRDRSHVGRIYRQLQQKPDAERISAERISKYSLVRYLLAPAYSTGAIRSYKVGFIALLDGEPPKDPWELSATGELCRELLKSCNLSEPADFYIRGKLLEIGGLRIGHEKPSAEVRAGLVALLESDPGEYGIFYRGIISGQDPAAIFAEYRLSASFLARIDSRLTPKRLAIYSCRIMIYNYKILMRGLLDGIIINPSTFSDVGKMAARLLRSSNPNGAVRSYLETTVAEAKKAKEADGPSREVGQIPSIWSRTSSLWRLSVGTVIAALIIGGLNLGYINTVALGIGYIALNGAALAGLLAYLVYANDKGQPIHPWTVMLAITALIVGSVGLPSLAFLAAGGGDEAFYSNFLNIYHRPLGLFEEILFILVPALLIAVPSKLRSINLDLQAATTQTQKALPRMLAVVAAIITSFYILLLHFDNGPLRTIKVGPLIAGTIFTVLLLIPWYSSIVRTCWRHELSTVFDPKNVLRPLHQMTLEVWSVSKRHFSRKFNLDILADRFLREDPAEANADSEKVGAGDVGPGDTYNCEKCHDQHDQQPGHE